MCCSNVAAHRSARSTGTEAKLVEPKDDDEHRSDVSFTCTVEQATTTRSYLHPQITDLTCYVDYCPAQCGLQQRTSPNPQHFEPSHSPSITTKRHPDLHLPVDPTPLQKTSRHHQHHHHLSMQENKRSTPNSPPGSQEHAWKSRTFPVRPPQLPP